MRKNKFTWLFIIIIIFTITADTLDSGNQQAGIQFPLYEDIKILSDYRLNQAIDLGLDWCSVGIFSGAVISGVLYPAFVDNHKYDAFGTPICMAISGSLSGIIGLLSGSIGGTIKGERYNFQRKQNSAFHLHKDWIGYEVWMLYAALSKPNSYNHFKSDLPGFSITVRLNRFNFKTLDEVRIGFIGYLDWRNVEYDSSTIRNDLRAYELRWSADFLKHFPLCKGYMVPYAGFGCGGVKLFFNQHLENQREKNGSAFVPFAGILTGIEFNALDFFFIRPELSYEIFGPYYKLKQYAEISPLRNFRFSLRSGCLLF